MDLMNLASYAVSKSEGRKHPERHEDNRGDFQRDKDRIIHCKAFRRLDKKTQVFSAGSGDHYRTRLTHTLEVAQIARDLARRLKLNEDLCEAIALAHDLGHPPFGHAGEATLNRLMKEHGLHFEHNEQSRRVVEVLEKSYPDFEGLNLTLEVLDGMIKHQTAFDQAGKAFEVAAHLEAQVVNLADEIAYTNHDIDDGLRAGLISISQLRGLHLWREAESEVKEKYGVNLEESVYVSRMISTIISLMIGDLCTQTELNLAQAKIQSLADVKKFQGNLAKFSSEMKEKVAQLRNFLYQNFYLNPEIEALNAEGQRKIEAMFRHLIQKGDAVAVKDYIAGMTDSFLEKEYSYIIGL